MARKKPEKQINELIKRAEAKGLEENFLYVTTLHRLKVQIDTMASLEEAIKENGMTVTKEYVKGRENICINPAITEYNRTATAANNTVTTIIKILDSFKGEEKEAGLNKMMADLMDDE